MNVNNTKQQPSDAEAGDIGHAELMCALDQYEYLGVLWANTVPMVG